MAERTDTKTLADALDVLAREIESGDGIANAAIAEAAQRLRELEKVADDACAYFATLMRMNIGAMESEIATLKARTEELERALDARQRQIDAIQSAYHGLVSPGEEFYSWQRDWQNAARALLDLGPDATVEDINLALLLRYKEADRG